MENFIGGGKLASKQIDINIKSTNSASGFKAAGMDIENLKRGAATAGQTIGTSINKGISTATAGFGKLQSTATSTFNTIKAGAQAARREMGDLGNAISAVAGGIGAMEVIQAAWTGSSQKQFNQAYLQTKMSAQAANEYISTIQKIVAEAPGDDTFMNNLLTGAVAKNTKMSNSELRQMAFIAADYMTVSKSMGKSMVETQNDLKEYLLTGNTTQLERDSILKGQMDTLEGQSTVSERILALDKAMRKEGYAGLSQLDIATIKWEEIKGKLQLAATTIGDKFLPYVEKVFDFFLKLDEQTNGFSSVLAVAAGAVTLIGLALAPVVGATLSGYYAMKNYRIEAEKAAIANALNKGAPAPVALGPAGAAPGFLQRFGSYISTGIMSVLSAIGVQMAAGATWGGTLSSMAMGLVNGLGAAIMKVGPAPLTAAFAGLFENVTPDVAGTGSFLSGNWDGFTAAFNREFGPGSATGKNIENLKQQWAGFTKTLQDGARVIDMWAANSTNLVNLWMGNIVPSFRAAGAWITGAWGNTVAYITGAWNNTVGSVIGAWYRLKGIVGSWIYTGISIATGAIDWARQKYNDLKNYIWNNPIVQTIRSVVGMGPGGARGPSGPDGISYSYQNYAGHQKNNVWNASGTCLTGNCVDMTMGLIGRYGGSMVSGTWNGGPHVWWQAPNGSQFDPARMALNGTGTPPPRGPGDGKIVIPVTIGGERVAKFIVDTVTKEVIDAGRY